MGNLSKDVRQAIEKAIEEEMEKIVQLVDKEHQQKAMDEINMDFAKIVAEQYEKQMAKQNAKMEELKKQLKMNSSDVRLHRPQLPRELQFEMLEFLTIDRQRRFVNLFKCSKAKLDKKIKHVKAMKKDRVLLLEAMFHQQKYWNRREIIKMASMPMLNMSESQVKTWFQNRRRKWSKQAILNSTPPPSPVIEPYILKAFYEAFNQV